LQKIGKPKNDPEIFIIMQLVRIGSKITQVFPIGKKETRCCGILSAKGPVFLGLLKTDYAKLFMNEPLVLELPFN